MRIRWTPEEEQLVKAAFERAARTHPDWLFKQQIEHAQEAALPEDRRRRIISTGSVKFLGIKLKKGGNRRAGSAPRGGARSVVPSASAPSAPLREISALDRLAAAVAEFKAALALVDALIDSALDRATDRVHAALAKLRELPDPEDDDTIHSTSKQGRRPSAARRSSGSSVEKAARAQRAHLSKEAPMPPSEVTPRTRADAPPRRRDPLTSVARRRRKVRSGAQAVRNAGPAPKPTRGASSKSQSEDRAASSSSDGETDLSRTGKAEEPRSALGLKRAACKQHEVVGHEPSCSACRIAEIRAAHERVSHA